ncbi:MAG: acyltransferase family protein [Firmicutes bacterium]|nr:acyltransferase family protein [Bacillota bacterium]
MRYSGIDFLRLVACAMVVILHSTSSFMFSGGNSDLFMILLSMASMIGVPIFVMLTGFLELHKESNKGLIKKAIKLYVLAVVAYLFAYGLNCKSFNQYVVSLPSIIKNILILKINNAPFSGHLWYVSKFMIFVYLFMPWIKVLARNKHALDFLLVLFGINAIYLLGFGVYADLLYPLFRYMAYLLLGHQLYLIRDKLGHRNSIFVWLAITILLTCVAYNFGQRPSNFTRFISCYDNLLIMISALGIFDFAFTIKKFPKLTGTLEIYLYQPVVIGYLSRLLDINNKYINLLVSILIATLMFAFINGGRLWRKQ